MWAQCIVEEHGQVATGASTTYENVSVEEVLQYLSKASSFNYIQFTHAIQPMFSQWTEDYPNVDSFFSSNTNDNTTFNATMRHKLGKSILFWFALVACGTVNSCTESGRKRKREWELGRRIPPRDLWRAVVRWLNEPNNTVIRHKVQRILSRCLQDTFPFTNDITLWGEIGVLRTQANNFLCQLNSGVATRQPTTPPLLRTVRTEMAYFWGLLPDHLMHLTVDLLVSAGTRKELVCVVTRYNELRWPDNLNIGLLPLCNISVDVDIQAKLTKIPFPTEIQRPTIGCSLTACMVACFLLHNTTQLDLNKFHGILQRYFEHYRHSLQQHGHRLSGWWWGCEAGSHKELNEVFLGSSGSSTSIETFYTIELALFYTVVCSLIETNRLLVLLEDSIPHTIPRNTPTTEQSEAQHQQQQQQQQQQQGSSNNTKCNGTLSRLLVHMYMYHRYTHPEVLATLFNIDLLSDNNTHAFNMIPPLQEKSDAEGSRLWCEYMIQMQQLPCDKRTEQLSTLSQPSQVHDCYNHLHMAILSLTCTASTTLTLCGPEGLMTVKGEGRKDNIRRDVVPNVPSGELLTIITQFLHPVLLKCKSRYNQPDKNVWYFTQLIQIVSRLLPSISLLALRYSQESNQHSNSSVQRLKESTHHLSLTMYTYILSLSLLNCCLGTTQIQWHAILCGKDKQQKTAAGGGDSQTLDSPLSGQAVVEEDGNNTSQHVFDVEKHVMHEVGLWQVLQLLPTTTADTDNHNTTLNGRATLQHELGDEFCGTIAYSLMVLFEVSKTASDRYHTMSCFHYSLLKLSLALLNSLWPRWAPREIGVHTSTITKQHYTALFPCTAENIQDDDVVDITECDVDNDEDNQQGGGAPRSSSSSISLQRLNYLISCIVSIINNIDTPAPITSQCLEFIASLVTDNQRPLLLLLMSEEHTYAHQMEQQGKYGASLPTTTTPECGPGGTLHDDYNYNSFFRFIMNRIELPDTRFNGTQVRSNAALALQIIIGEVKKWLKQQQDVIQDVPTTTDVKTELLVSTFMSVLKVYNIIPICVKFGINSITAPLSPNLFLEIGVENIEGLLAFEDALKRSSHIPWSDRSEEDCICSCMIQHGLLKKMTLLVKDIKFMEKVLRKDVSLVSNMAEILRNALKYLSGHVTIFSMEVAAECKEIAMCLFTCTNVDSQTVLKYPAVFTTLLGLVKDMHNCTAFTEWAAKPYTKNMVKRCLSICVELQKGHPRSKPIQLLCAAAQKVWNQINQ